MRNGTALTEARRFERVLEILDEYNREASKIIPILQAIQEEYRYLPEEILTYAATALDMSPAKVYGIATFYSHFSLEPKGAYVIKVCDGTACHVKGSGTLVEKLRSSLGLTQKKKTTDDMRFTVETVSCLGACGLAPVMLVNERVYGQVTPERADEILAEYSAMEDENADD
jgi:NADH-quinone oxidoreductase subunit E